MAAFAPLIGDRAHTLLLGSMPGQQSLQAHQYYAHPRNSFWWIMAQLFGIEEQASYAQRVQQLNNAGLAVWDVLHDCERPGSLDSDIKRHSEIPNDFAALFADHPEIRIIGFNGATAEALFRRHNRSLLASAGQRRFVRLPSTSPAHAALSREEKVQHWRHALLGEKPA